MFLIQSQNQKVMIQMIARMMVRNAEERNANDLTVTIARKKMWAKRRRKRCLETEDLASKWICLLRMVVFKFPGWCGYKSWTKR